MKAYKKQTTPKMSSMPFKVAIIRTRKLHEKLFEDCCISIDDKSYIKIDTRALPGPDFIL